MKGNHNRLRVFAGICVLLISLGMVSPVSADGPVKSIIVRDYYETEVPGELCSFPIEMHSYGEIHLLTWYDADGNITKQQELWGQINQSLTANGKTLYTKVSGPGHYTFPSPTEMIIHGSGPVSFTVVPGYGPVGWGTGSYMERYVMVDGVWTLVEASGWHGIWVEDLTDFCAYFES